MKTQKDTKSVIRTLSTIIAAILLLFSISVIAGCKNKGNSNNNNSKAEVVLDKVSAAAYKETSVKPQKMAAFNFRKNQQIIPRMNQPTTPKAKVNHLTFLPIYPITPSSSNLRRQSILTSN